MERVVVVGGSMAGLAAALWLQRSGYAVTVLERDPAPPDIAPGEAFEAWARPGVPQFRHAHILLGRTQTMLRDHFPELLSELLAAGIERSSLTEVLPETQVDDYQPRPGDEDLIHLWGRRPTFEYVFRRHVGRLPGVAFVHDAQVVGLLTERDDAAVRVVGVDFKRGGKPARLLADAVVDASGKRSRCPQWLRDQGVEIERESHPSGRTYVCRHYRLDDPARGRAKRGTGVNLDYFAFVVFYAEHGHFAITMSCATEEQAFARAMAQPEGFDAICAAMPLLRSWTERAHPTSKVLGAAGFENRWSHFATAGGKSLAGYFPVGDVHIETNPVYGRGCTFALLQAEMLAAALDGSTDPVARTRDYLARARAGLRLHFDFCAFSDKMFGSRARHSRGEAIPVGERALHWAYDRIWTPALARSPVCGREMVRAMQMRELSGVGERCASAAHVMLYGTLALLTRRRPALPGGPTREQALSLVAAAQAGERAAVKSA